MALQLPGYAFDPVTNRYFKLAPGRIAPSASITPSKRDKPPQRKRPRLHEKGQKETSGLRTSDAVFKDRALSDPRSNRTTQTHAMQSYGAARMSVLQTLYPDCLPNEEDIEVISFDALDPNIVRVGGSSGSIASTCLGPPAQALIGTTRDSVSLASVTLTPRKTSLWTSALAPNLVALGCDRKVLVSRDPSRNQMDGLVTGDRHGGGAVFALDLTENLIFAGTRKGHVKIFDQRSSPTREAAEKDGPESKAEIHVKLKTSVTNIRRIEQGVLVATIDGSMGMYDLRFVTSRPVPFTAFSGHVNAYSNDLGFDVFNDQYVAAAGNDKKVRLWSLRSSDHSPILSPVSSKYSNSPWSRTFEAPVKALTFGPHKKSVPRRDDGWLEDDQDDDWSRWGRKEMPRLWVGDGPSLMEFGLPI